MNPSRRRSLRYLTLACFAGAGWPSAFAADGDAALRSLLPLGFELLEDHPDPGKAADHARRLAAAGQQLRDGLTQLGLYGVLDAAPVQSVIDALRARHAFLYTCAGCAQTAGQAAGAELVAVGWVQKVSELILNLNVEVREVASDRVLLSMSVDLRGNNDESWMRAVRFMLRDWAEKRAINPRYGQ